MPQLNYQNNAIDYQLVRERRATIKIIVHRDLRVVVKAPTKATQAQINEVLDQRGAWILKQVGRFAAMPTLPAAPQYQDGELHPYLGKEYPLQISEASREQVAFDGTVLAVQVKDGAGAERVAALLKNWYRREAQRLFSERLAVCFPLVEQWGVPYPSLHVREMKTRWGSCSGRLPRVNLNTRLLYAPLECIDYVIVHELCHLKEHNHSPRYYALLTEAMPDWQERKHRLNQIYIG